jgi:hypothetical protein
VRGQFALASTDHPAFKQGYAFGHQMATQNGADQKTAHFLALNNAEHALQDQGFDGYGSPQHPGIHFFFGDADASPVITHQHKPATESVAEKAAQPVK